LPIITSLETLDKTALVRIMKEPKNALIKQYVELMKHDDVTLKFEDDAVEENCRHYIKAEDRCTWFAQYY
jgi:ATP-dependent Clp protease ATP-binding subunit ClpX